MRRRMVWVVHSWCSLLLVLSSRLSWADIGVGCCRALLASSSWDWIDRLSLSTVLLLPMGMRIMVSIHIWRGPIQSRV